MRFDRRQALQILAGAALLPLVGCGEDAGSQELAEGGSCDEIPEETAGPYPGDGSNGPNALSTSGVVRSDIVSSFGGMTGTAGGVPLRIELSLVDAVCAPLAGYAVYLWHCDREGRYSLYSSGATDQNYLRGVQESDADGKVVFQSIFPGCYAGRWPHIHFEIFSALSAATSLANKIATSQLALPADVCNAVYATSGYSASVSNLARLSLESDGIFADGHAQQLAAVNGDTSSGYVASLKVGL